MTLPGRISRAHLLLFALLLPAFFLASPAQAQPQVTCGLVTTLISEVQGNGAASPLDGQVVEIEGIVTGAIQDVGILRGLFVQEEADDTDADPLTSEGLIAFTDFPAAVGDHVRIRGVVDEFNGLTRLFEADFAVCSTGNSLPAAIALTLPKAAADSFERYENMRVTLPDGLVVNDLFTLWRFGEYTVSSVRRFQPTQIVEPGAPAIAQATANALDALLVDDGRSSQNLVITHLGQDDTNPFTALNPIRIGMTVSGLAGIMYFSNNTYRLQPTQPHVVNENANPRTAAPAAVGGTLRIGSMNVLNYFSTLTTAGPVCGPLGNQECRGANSVYEFNRQTAKIVAALTALNADVVGLIEIENNASASLVALVNALNAATAPGTYAYIDTGTIGGDAIKQAVIYKPASVTPEGDFALLTTAVDARFNDTLNRPSLAQSFRSNGNLALFTVVVNHLKSKGGNCDSVPDPDTGDGQGVCNLTRKNAAAALADWADADPTGTGSDQVLLLGDMNSYAKEDPIDELTAEGFTNLAAQFAGVTPTSSFNFQGQSGTLDYAMGNVVITPQVTGATIWHINSDEALVLDYNEEFGKPAQYLFDGSPESSDHDPVLVGLDLDAPNSITIPTTDPEVDADVEILGGGPGCGFSEIAFIDPNTITPPPPGNLGFPYGVLQFTAVRCTVGSTITVQVTLPEIPGFAGWYKFLESTGWAVYPSSLIENTFNIQFTDGGMGDADGSADGTIVDPSGPAVVAEARTSFQVSKVFSDDNPGSVEVVLNCFTGLPLTQSQTINASQDVIFIVTDFDPGELDCTVSESETEGYTPSFIASLGQSGVAGSVGNTDEACTFDDVVDGRMICQITNILDEVTITVNKEWIVLGAGEAEVQDVNVTLHCDGHLGEVGNAWINPNEPGIFTFLPHYNGTNCFVTESPVDGVETDDSDCQDLFVEPGVDDACTVVNTQFFEGIPALSGPGLVVLSLLMLGVGLVGFRRVH